MGTVSAGAFLVLPVLRWYALAARIPGRHPRARHALITTGEVDPSPSHGTIIESTPLTDPMTDHTWTENAMRCAAARLRDLRPFEHQSWAHYRQQRERETLTALYTLYWSQQ